MKVLMINHILLGEENATGISLRNMLLGIPDMEYMQFCMDCRRDGHTELVDTIYLDKNDRLTDQFKGLFFKKASPPAKAVSAELSGAFGTSPLREALQGAADVLPCRLSKTNFEKIRQFAPDIIYTLGGNIRIMRMASKISELFAIPVVFHCMDDWRSTMYTSSPLAMPFHFILQKECERLHSRSVINLGICEKMAEFYSAEYHKPYSHVCNCVLRLNEEPYRPDASAPLKILFSGGLHFHRGERLQQIGELIEALNREGCAIELYVFAPPAQAQVYAPRYESLEHTHCLPYVEAEKQMENLMSADILLHAESDNEADNRYMRYSFSTKLVEYFAAGRCVLGFGDRSLSSIEYIEKSGCGMAAENLEQLRSCLMKLYANGELRSAFAKNAVKTAREKHSQKAVQAVIRDTFLKAKENYAKENLPKC